MSEDSSRPMALIVGGDTLLREGIGALLSPAFRTNLVPDVVGAGFTRALEQLRPNLVMFLNWPSQPHVFLAAFKKLKAAHPGVRTIILSDEADHEILSDALAAGVDGFLTRDINAESLRHSLQLVMLGERAYSARVVDQLLRGRRMAPVEVKTGTGATLTNRQRDILRCLAEGRSNKDIARRLGTSEATVKVQVRSLLRRIGVENRTQAAIWAIDAGINETSRTVSQLRSVS